jgi:hypothetical protein
MIIIGIDPGKTGAAVAIDGDKNILAVYDNRESEKTLAYITEISRKVYEVVYACVERQQYMPRLGRRQGGKSAFSLGGAYGYWIGFLEAFPTITLYTPYPREWQRYHFTSGTVISSPKERSIRAAGYLLPELELVPPGCRVPSHGRTDAGLIALYGLAKTMSVTRPVGAEAEAPVL